MPPLESGDLDERCVLYRRVGTDGQGEPVVQYPRQYPCRWVETVRQIKNKDGETVEIEAQVAITNCPSVPLKSIVWRGGLNDVPGTADPPEPGSELYEVVAAKSARDVKGNACRIELMLQRFNDTLPTTLSAADSVA